MALESDLVLDDPFFGVVRRRHPDVDIVLLPPESVRPARPAGTDPGHRESLGAQEFAEIARQDLAELEERARDCAAGHRLIRESDEGWVASSDGMVSRRRLFAAHEVDAGEGIALINAAAATLDDDGWQVLRPSSGQSRVLARRGPLSLHVVQVPSARRLAVITHAGPYPVVADVVEQLAADQHGTSRPRPGDHGTSLGGAER